MDSSDPSQISDPAEFVLVPVSALMALLQNAYGVQSVIEQLMASAQVKVEFSPDYPLES